MGMAIVIVLGVESESESELTDAPLVLTKVEVLLL